jgi:serine/threonine protein kinase
MDVAHCLSESLLVAFADGQLVDRQRSQVTDHIDGCTDCLKLLAAVARRGEHEPGDTVVQPAATDSQTDKLWKPPLELEEYRLIEAIGRGASGQVWRAHDQRLDRAVAIKFLSAPSKQVARERFELEARAIARLQHPNVVTVHRVGEVEGRPFLVSELVRGKSLDRLTKPVSWRRALELSLGLARGMAAAHAAGVLHRDIKPANAILADTGEVKLVDFGLAKLLDPGRGNAVPPVIEAEGSGPVAMSPTGLTTTGMFLGTPLYMAPEAWSGAAPTARMDVYSLGAVIYELCTGRTPHSGQRLAELRQNVTRYDAAPLELVRPDVDLELVAVVMRCVRRDPEERWASGVELCAALEQVYAHATTHAPAPRRFRVDRWTAAIAVGLVGSLVGVGALVVHDYRHDQATRTSQVTRARTLGSEPAPHAVAPVVVSADEVEGLWMGDFGKLLVHVDDEGTLRGVYVHDEGTVMGHFEAGELVGWWCETDRGRITPNGVPRQPPLNAGTAHFRFLRDDAGQLIFDGQWQQGDSGIWHEDWDMRKIDEPVDPSLRARLARSADYCTPPEPAPAPLLAPR